MFLWFIFINNFHLICVYFVFVLIISVLMELVVYLKKHFFNYRSLRSLPQPISVPFFGNGYLFLGCNTQDIYNVFVSLIRKYGQQSAFKFWAGNKLFVVLTQPEDLRTLYNSNWAVVKDYDVYKFFGGWLGWNSLLIAQVPKWRLHRRILAMTFTQTILDRFVTTLSMHSNRLCDELSIYSNSNKIVNVYDVIIKYTVPSICETIMGLGMDRYSNLIERYTKALSSQAAIIYSKMCKFWLQCEHLYNLTKMSIVETENLKSLHKLTETIYNTKKVQQLENSWSVDTEDSKGYGFNPKRKPLLDLLLNLNQKSSRFYDPNDIQDDINIFLAAGSDTTAITFSFALLLLGIHPEIQNKLYTEISGILGSSRDITAADIKRMVYLEMVIKETLRLYPTVPIVSRYLTRPMMLKDKIEIPAGVSVIAAPLAVHYNRIHWPNPGKFIPERFTPEMKMYRDSYSFIPFSGGIRNCLGKKYAFVSLKVLIASVIRDFEIRTDLKMEEIKFKIEITLKSVQGYPIQLVGRHSLGQN